MELLYVWVEEYGNIKRQGFNFSPNYDFKVKEENGEYILVDNFETSGKKKQPEKFFGNNISNITAIVGKNGSGKSNLLYALRNKSINQPVDDEDKKREFIYIAKLNPKDTKLKLITNIEKVSFNEDKLDKEDKIDKSTHDTKGIFYTTIPYQNEAHVDLNILNVEFATYDINNRNSSLKNEMLDKIKSLEENEKLSYTNIKSILEDDLSIYESSLPEYINALSFISNTTFIKSSVGEVVKKNVSIELNLKSTIYSESLSSFIKNESIKMIKTCYQTNRRDKTFFENLIFNFLCTKKEYIDEFEKKNPKSFEKLFVIDKEIVESISSDSEKSQIKTFENSIVKIEKLVKDKEWYKISIAKKNYKEIISNLSILSNVVSCSFYPLMSSGQLQLMKIFSKIHRETKFDINNYIILLDEPDLTLHPEWQRVFLSEIKLWLNSITHLNFQIILTSHSPFVASDLPRENVIMLDTDKDGNCIVKKDKEIKTFGANIFDLYTEAFFVESSFGEFSKGKIKEVVELLTYETKDNERKYNIDKDGFINEKYKEDLESIPKEIEKLKKLIKELEEYNQYNHIKQLELNKKLNEIYLPLNIKKRSTQNYSKLKIKWRNKRYQNYEKTSKYISNYKDTYSKRNAFKLQIYSNNMIISENQVELEYLKNTETVEIIRKQLFNEIEYILNSIGEPLVKNKLQKMYDEYRNHKNSAEYKKEKLKELMKKTGMSREDLESLLENGEI